jgi:hypothetical protein
MANTFTFSRAHFYYGSKKWFIVLIGSLFSLFFPLFSLGTFTIHYQSHSQVLTPLLLWENNNNNKLYIYISNEEWKNHYFRNGLDETSCGKFDKKPFLIRFRNRKYPFCFLSDSVYRIWKLMVNFPFLSSSFFYKQFMADGNIPKMPINLFLEFFVQSFFCGRKSSIFYCSTIIFVI